MTNKLSKKMSALSRTRTRRMLFESLESRRVLYSATLSNGLLRVTAAAAGESLTLSVDTGEYKVNGNATGFFTGPLVTSLRMQGANGDDTLTIDATVPSLPSTLVGNGGEDILVADYGGDAKFGGGAGDDEMYGGSGNDFFNGDAGSDKYFGGDGDDRILFDADDPTDSINGEGGHDRAEATGTFTSGITVQLYDRGLEEVIATEFDDILDAQAPVVIAAVTGVLISGRGGNDIIYGSDDNDNLNGGAGDDEIYGFGGDDLIAEPSVGSGNDWADGGDGKDYIRLQDGDDWIMGGLGGDGIDGAGGFDIVDYSTSPDPAGVRANLSGGANLGGYAAGDSYSNINGIIGSAFNDTLIGKNGVVGYLYLDGRGGDDKISGGDGVDVIWGGEGNDLINTLGGNDVIHGEAGADDIRGGDGDDEIYGEAGNDRLRGEGGNNTVYGGDDIDTVFVTNNADQVYGEAGSDTLSFAEMLLFGANYSTTGRGFEIVNGSSFDDIISHEGDANAITIRGHNGNDTLTGGDGIDRLEGGLGGDTLNGSGATDDGVRDRLDAGSDADVDTFEIFGASPNPDQLVNNDPTDPDTVTTL